MSIKGKSHWNPGITGTATRVEEQQEQRPINNVPIEVWIELFKFLDFEWLIVVCQVCKFWKHASFFVLRRLQRFPLQKQFSFFSFFFDDH